MNIKELAEQAGLGTTSNDAWYPLPIGLIHLVRFAELVAEQTHTNNKAKWYQEGYEAGQRDEREKCARLCDDLSEGLVGDDVDGAWGAGHCARAIEARGEK